MRHEELSKAEIKAAQRQTPHATMPIGALKMRCVVSMGKIPRSC